MTISFVMSAPQLADSSTSSEWFRTVADAEAAEKPRTPSQVSIPTDVRRKRFVRLVTYTMGGLVAFTLLGIASFAWRRHSMQSALAAPAPAPVAAPAPEGPVAVAPAAEAAPAAAVAPAKPAVVAKRSVGASKPAKKAARSPFLSAPKSTPSKASASSARKP